MFGQSTFGSNSTFGANQNKPAFGGFGSTATSQPNTSFGGGLFGQQQQQQTTSSGNIHWIFSNFDVIVETVMWIYV